METPVLRLKYCRKAAADFQPVRSAMASSWISLCLRSESTIANRASSIASPIDVPVAERKRFSAMRREPGKSCAMSAAVRPVAASRMMRSRAASTYESCRLSGEVEARRTTCIGPKKMFFSRMPGAAVVDGEDARRPGQVRKEALKPDLDSRCLRRVHVDLKNHRSQSVDGEHLGERAFPDCRPGGAAKQCDEGKMAASKADDLLGCGYCRSALAVEYRGNAVRRIVYRAVEKYTRREAERLGLKCVADAGAIRDAAIRLPEADKPRYVGDLPAVFNNVDGPVMRACIPLYALQSSARGFIRHVLKIENGLCHGGK